MYVCVCAERAEEKRERAKLWPGSSGRTLKWKEGRKGKEGKEDGGTINLRKLCTAKQQRQTRKKHKLARGQTFVCLFFLWGGKSVKKENRCTIIYKDTKIQERDIETKAKKEQKVWDRKEERRVKERERWCVCRVCVCV